MKFTKLALSLLSCAVLFCGCTKNNDIVLKINDKEITKAEFYGDFNKLKNVQLKNAPKELQRNDSYAVLALKDRYTNDVIARELLSQEYAKRNIQASKEEIEAVKKKIIAQMGEEQFNRVLKENNISQERLDSDMASEVKVEKLVNSLSVKKVTDSDIEKFYKQNKAQFDTPERVRVSHILIDTTPEGIKRAITDADKEAKLSSSDIEAKVKEEVARKEKLAADVRAKALANPKKFADLATQYSEDEGTAKKGGDLGFVTRESVVKEFGDAAFTQKVGVVGPLVKSQYGQHIILVTDKSAKGTQSLASVKADLKGYLEQQRKVKAMQDLITGLKSSATIEYVDPSLNPEGLKKQLEEAMQKQIDKEKQKSAPKSKQKLLENNK